MSLGRTCQASLIALLRNRLRDWGSPRSHGHGSADRRSCCVFRTRRRTPSTPRCPPTENLPGRRWSRRLHSRPVIYTATTVVRAAGSANIAERYRRRAVSKAVADKPSFTSSRLRESEISPRAVHSLFVPTHRRAPLFF